MKHGLVILAFVASALAVRAQPPNVLFIAVDDLKPLLGSYGDGVARSPHIDRLASRGTAFLNAHCQQAVCAPSRASLLTGKRPDTIRIWDLKTKIRRTNPGIVTLPEYFKAQGYETAGLGKIYDPRSVDGRATHDEDSWSVPYQPTWKLPFNEETGPPVTAYHGARIRKLAEAAKAEGITEYGDLSDFLQRHEAWPAVEAEDVPDDAYEDGAMARRAVELMGELAATGRPFFLAVGFKKPHLPFVAPKRYWDLYDRDAMPLAARRELPEGSPPFAGHDFPELRSYSGIPPDGPVPQDQQRELIHGYYACMSYIDTQVGRLLDALDDLGLSDHTVVVLWGDHGWHLGDHGLWTKHTNYEQATRAPLIVAPPGGAPIRVTSAPVEFVDIFPTLCDLGGLPAPENLAGVSLAPLMTGETASAKPYAISQFPRGKRMGYALRTRTHRLVAWIPKDNPGDIARSLDRAEALELYDYEQDPLETVNLADDPAQAGVVAELSDALNTFLQTQ